MEEHVRYDDVNKTHAFFCLANVANLSSKPTLCWNSAKSCARRIMLTCLTEFWVAAEAKEPYEAKARADKKRYKDEIGGYNSKNAQPSNADSMDESDSQ